MPERVYVDYGPHFAPDTEKWELHLQRSAGSPRYRFESAWATKEDAIRGAHDLATQFRDDTTYVDTDDTRRVVAVKFIHC